MSAYKDEKRGTWYVFFYYRDWQGNNKGKTKRGFKSRKEALAWERDFLQRQSDNLDMEFENFVQVYSEDMEVRLKHNTWLTKKHIIEKKILPYFGKQKINKIRPADIIKWQNAMMNSKNQNDKSYSPTYLKTMHNQLSAIFNHAVRFYDLKSNPASKAGSMGREKSKEMLFWTKEEYLKFAEVIKDKPQFYYAFEVLYWSGIRMGELLALTARDIDLDVGTITINKSYQRLEGKDFITDPKTPKSNRTINIPQFLCKELESYLNQLYGFLETDRIFGMTKSALHHEMDRGAKKSGVKRIRIHDLRHSHVSLLIEMGFSTVAIAERVGHESIDITYRYAHLFPTKQREMADKLDMLRAEGNGEENAR